MPVLLNSSRSTRGWSRIGSFLLCPRKFAYKAEADVQPGAETNLREPLVLGSLLHIGLAHHYAIMKGDQAYYEPAEAMAQLAETFGEMGSELLPKALQTVALYQRVYLRETFKVLHVEDEFFTKLGGFDYSARYDLVVEDTKGRVWVYDHKSTAKVKTDTVTKYAMSGQMLGQRHIAREVWGDRFAGIIINVIAHIPPAKFQRQILPETPTLQRQFAATIANAEERLVQLVTKSADEYPAVASDQVCHGVYGPCEFLKRCSGMR